MMAIFQRNGINQIFTINKLKTSKYFASHADHTHIENNKKEIIIAVEKWSKFTGLKLFQLIIKIILYIIASAIRFLSSLLGIILYLKSDARII